MTTQFMMLDFDETEMAAIQAAAIEAGLNTHEFARRTLLGIGIPRPQPKVEIPAALPSGLEIKPAPAGAEVKNGNAQ